MKQSPSVTRLIVKVSEALEQIAVIYKHLVTKPTAHKLTVTFRHAIDGRHVSTSWSDREFQNPLPTSECVIEYTYEVKSSGIHFISYSKGTRTSGWLTYDEHWGMHDEEKYNTMSLAAVPNKPPPGYKNTMYAYHQECIRKVFVELPAWATVVGVDY